MRLSSVPAPFVDKATLSLLNDLGTLVEKSTDYRYRIYFWIFNCIPLTSMFILMPVPHCPDECCFCNKFWNWEFGGLPILFFYFKIVLAVLSPLSFLWILGSACQFLQRSYWDSDKDFVESIDQFGEYCYPNNGKSAGPWTCNFSQLFNFSQQWLVVFSVYVLHFLVKFIPEHLILF